LNLFSSFSKHLNFKKLFGVIILIAIQLPVSLSTFAQEITPLNLDNSETDITETTENNIKNPTFFNPDEITRPAINGNQPIVEMKEVPIERREDMEELPDDDTEPESIFSDTLAGTLFINNENVRSAAPIVDTQTGSLQYNYSLVIPSGRNGLSPSIEFRYDSNETKNANIAGYGWNISIPTISRLNKYGVNTLYQKDTFISSVDGELVRSENSNVYIPRIENGAFRKYEFENNTWIITEKDGTKLIFGSSTGARKDDPADANRIYSWYLEKIVNTRGDYIGYSYFKDQGQIYPERVTYGGNSSNEGIFKIEFLLENRTDVINSYETGFSATTTQRISRVDVKVNNDWVKRYDIGYDTGHNNYRSLLSTITESGKNETGDVVSLPSIGFQYEN